MGPNRYGMTGLIRGIATLVAKAHALKAAEDGDLRVTTPSGETLLVRYDRRIAHGSGDWTWVGHLLGQESEQTILTFGPHAAFGTIAQSGKPPLRLTVRNGVSWLVETDPTKVAVINNAATRPALPDYHLPPPKNLPQAPSAASAPPMAAAPPTAAATTASTPTTVDVVLGYTPAFAADNGGQSGAITRLNYLVDVTNVAYQNSGIDARVRLVATVPVSYADDTSNDSTLDQLTGYNSSTNTTTSPNAAFNALRAAREQYGADLVSLVRSFRDPENGGCGVAWLIGGGQQGVSASDSYYGYSVVSDGSDPGTDGHTYIAWTRRWRMSWATTWAPIMTSTPRKVRTACSIAGITVPTPIRSGTRMPSGRSTQSWHMEIRANTS